MDIAILSVSSGVQRYEFRENRRNQVLYGVAYHLKHEPPNLIPPILCYDVIDVGVWERSRVEGTVRSTTLQGRLLPTQQRSLVDVMPSNIV